MVAANSIKSRLEDAYLRACVGMTEPDQVRMSPATFKSFMHWRVDTSEPKTLLGRYGNRPEGVDFSFVRARFNHAHPMLDLALSDGVLQFRASGKNDPRYIMNVLIHEWTGQSKKAAIAVTRTDNTGQYSYQVLLDGKEIGGGKIDDPFICTQVQFGGFTAGVRVMFGWLAKLLKKQSQWLPKVEVKVSGTREAAQVVFGGDYTPDPPGPAVAMAAGEEQQGTRHKV